MEENQSILDGEQFLKFWYNHLSFIFETLNSHYNYYLEKWEEKVFEILFHSENIFELRHLATAASVMIVPLIIPLIITLITLIILIFIPTFCYTNFCKTKGPIISEFKYPWLFGVKFLLTIIFTASLLFLTTLTINVTIKLENEIRNNIKTAYDVVNDLKNARNEFELQLHDVNKTIIDTMQSIPIMITRFPRNIITDMNESIDFELNEATYSYNNIMAKSILMFDRLEMNNTGKLLKTFNKNIDTLYIDAISDKYFYPGEIKDNFLNDLLKIKQLTLLAEKDYTNPNWANIYDIQRETYKNLMPQIKIDLEFLDVFSKKINTDLKANEIEIYSSTKKIIKESQVILNKLYNISGSVYHENIKNIVNKTLTFSNNTLYNINGCTKFSPYFLNTTFMFITPSIHSFICAILITLVGSLVVYQMQCSSKHFVEFSSFNNCTILLFRLIILFALSLLWTGLILSTFCYMGALSLSLVCRPIITDNLYKVYIDNEHVWGNKTWLDSLVYPWNHNYKLEEILLKCSKNVTIYEAFEVEKYWQVSDLFTDNKIFIDEKKLKEIIKKDFDLMRLPNKKFCNQVKENFDLIEKEITNMSLELRKIKHDTDLYLNPDIKAILLNMTKNYGNFVQEPLQENIEILKKLENEKLDFILSDFMEFTYLIKSQQNDIIIIKDNEAKLIEKLKSKIDEIILKEIHYLKEIVNNLINKLEKKLTEKVTNEIGNCHVFYKSIEIAKQKACIDMPLLFNYAWFLLLLNAFVLIFDIICCCRIRNSIILIRNEKILWKERLEIEKQNMRRKRLITGTLLFDRSGKLMGDSRTLMTDTPQLEKIN